MVTKFQKFSLAVTLSIASTLLGCDKYQELGPKQIIAVPSGKTATDSTTLLMRARQAASNSIGNGWAYGQPLQTGVNWRMINTRNISTIQRNLGVLQDWWPSRTATYDQTFSQERVLSSQSAVSMDFGSNIAANTLKNLIEVYIGVNASKTVTNSITTRHSLNLLVPKFKQMQWRVLEKRVGWSATLVQITVIGNPSIATTTNGTLKIANFSVAGNYPIGYVNDAIFR